MIGLGKRETTERSLVGAKRQVQTSVATVSSRVLWLFVVAVQRLDVDAQPELERMQLSEGQLRDPDVRVTYPNAYRLIERLVACCARGDLGLLAARELQQGYFDLLELAVRSAPTLGDAIEQLIRFFDLLDDGAKLTLTRGPVFSEMSYLVNGDLPVHPAYVEFIPAMLLIAARRETKVATLGGERISFRHTNAASVELYRELFRTPVDFNATENLAIFRSEILALPFYRANALLEQQATAAIRRSVCKALE